MAEIARMAQQMGIQPGAGGGGGMPDMAKMMQVHAYIHERSMMTVSVLRQIEFNLPVCSVQVRL